MLKIKGRDEEVGKGDVALFHGHLIVQMGVDQ
jgi:hypothetical protein